MIPSDGFFYPHQTAEIDSFFLHTFWSPAFEFNVGVAINESHSYTLTSAIFKVDVICDVAMMSFSNVLTTELRDLLYNQCIDNTCCYSFLAHLSRRLTRWAYRMGLEPASVRPSMCPSVRLCVHTFKHEYLLDQQADYNQILSEASLGWGKGCIRFWCRSDQNSGFHGNG